MAIRSQPYGPFISTTQITLQLIPDLFAAYGYGPIGEKLARALPVIDILGLQIMQQLDEASAHAAQSQVELWKESDELPLPNLSKEEIEQLKGTPQSPPAARQKPILTSRWPGQY